jgi:ribonuclease HII
MATGKGDTGRRRKPLVYKGRALRCGSHFEREARASGFLRVAGIDEVGRGALCGPVVAAVVVLGDDFETDGLDDSKRLTARQRERLCERIRGNALAFGLGWVDPVEIDRINILRATYLAMRRALEALVAPPDLILVDALTIPEVRIEQRPIVKGDALSVSIAAASILAKVERDARMRELGVLHPGYDMESNMGYASASHLDALRRMGPSAVHRRTFHGTQPWLF